MQAVTKIFRNPTLGIVHLCRIFPFRLISDKKYLELFFYAYQGKKLNLDNPNTFNEKLQWLKLYDRNPLYTELSDKYLVREYVKETIGEQYLTRLYGVWDKVNGTILNDLPNQFVLKCNHDSGSVVICRDKRSVDWKKAFAKLNKNVSKNYYWKSREYNYLNIQRRIIAEEYLTDGNNDELTDYKVFCFDGEAKFIQVDSGRFSNHIRNFYDCDWNFLDVEYGCKNDSKRLDRRPDELPEILALAEKLSKGMPHVRVDFYVSNHRVYFGEMTFHHGGGAMIVRPYDYDIIWGNYLHLPQ